MSYETDCGGFIGTLRCLVRAFRYQRALWQIANNPRFRGEHVMESVARENLRRANDYARETISANNQ